MTAKKHFTNGLSEINAFKAINNTSEEELQESRDTLAEAILLSFRWNKTPEGFLYWHRLFKQACKNQKETINL